MVIFKLRGVIFTAVTLTITQTLLTLQLGTVWHLNDYQLRQLRCVIAITHYTVCQTTGLTENNTILLSFWPDRNDGASTGSREGRAGQVFRWQRSTPKRHSQEWTTSDSVRVCRFTPDIPDNSQSLPQSSHVQTTSVRNFPNDTQNFCQQLHPYTKRSPCY